MRKLLSLLAALFIFSTCFATNKITRIQNKLNIVCNELVPDKRVDICQVKVSKGKNGKIELWGEVLNENQKEKILAAVSGERITDKIIILPDTSIIKKPWGLITVSVANLKGEPSHSSEMVSQAILGTPVRILKKVNGWLFIQTPDHYLAWATTSSVQDMDFKEMENWRKSERLLYPGNYGLVHADTTLSEIISDLVAGSILQKTGETGTFYKIILPDHRAGVIPKNSMLDFDIWKSNVEPTPEHLIATARKFLGLPYTWGGTSSKTVDCSGLVKTVWFLNGIILERDASQQFKYGVVIEDGDHFENLQPGDVMFFGNKDPLRVTHTGMYIGNGELINSRSGSSRVTINSLEQSRYNFSQYLWNIYVGTKRILGQTSRFGYMPVKDHPWY
jgi:hypothetical protein